MAAISITPKTGTLQGLVPVYFSFVQLTTLDWINLAGARGFIGAIGVSTATANATAGALVTFKYGEIVINSSALTAASTTLPCDGAGAKGTGLGRIVPYFAKTPTGEIIEVIAESAPDAAASNLTVRRGCLGTTAGALADNDNLSIMNQFVVGNAAVGPVSGLAFPMPEDAGSKPLV
jgi:hypothetical protein